MANPSDEVLRQIYADSETIAVVGVSTDESKPSNIVPRYMQRMGFRVIPISPKGGELLGEAAHTSLDDVKAAVDVVDVFRPAEEAPGIAKQAVALGAKVLWLQAGIYSEEAEAIAREGGLEVVMDICIGVTHGRLGLGPGPYG